MGYGNRLKDFMHYKGLKKAREVSDLLGHKHPENIARILRSDDAKPSADLLEELSNVFDELDMTWLITGKGSMVKGSLPLKPNVHILENKASAGFGAVTSPENGLEQYYMPLLDGKPGTYIDIEVDGDSMEPTLYDGDHVIAKKVEDLHDIIGGHVFVIDRKDGEALIKRIYDKDKEHFELVSDNELYQPKLMHKEEDVNDLYRFVLRITNRARK